MISCLLSALNSPKALITDECRAKLKDRERLWQVANQEANVKLPDNVQDFVRLALDSPARCVMREACHALNRITS